LYSKQKWGKLDQLVSYGTGLMQSDSAVSIRFSDEFEQGLYTLSKSFAIFALMFNRLSSNYNKEMLSAMPTAGYAYALRALVSSILFTS
ncbi:MAG: hypothetical protein ACYT04_85845, partial [Nostoc sp.]